MIARSFRSVGWVAGIGGAALGCYMLSLQVAAERAELANVEARIARTHQAIRDLQTELGTRGRLSQLEHWNADVLALAAPAAGQFVDNEVVLARLETRSGELADGAPVQLASADTASVAPTAPAQVRTAAATTGSAPTPAPAPTAPVVRRASLASTPAPAAARPAAPAVVQASSETRPAVTRAPARTRAVALLDPATARELGETARAERRERSPGGDEPRPRANPTASRD